MPIDIGLVFSGAVAMVKERWLAMLGLWATFLGFLFLYGIVVFAVVGGSMFAMAGAGMAAGGFDDPTALAGMGAGVVLIALLFYIGYFAIAFGQQGAMVAAASPLERIGFGDAFGRGLKGGLTMLGVMVLFVFAYLIAMLVLALLGFILSFLGSLGGIIIALIALVGGVYLACRFAVLIPVIVVEKVYNPITAINRSWHITAGKALGIFVVVLLGTVIAALIIVPTILLIGASFDPGSGAEPGIGAVIVLFVAVVVMSFAFLFFYSALVASLHAQVSDTQAVEFSKTFE
jgi:hypothetical protein